MLTQHYCATDTLTSLGVDGVVSFCDLVSRLFDFICSDITEDEAMAPLGPKEPPKTLREEKKRKKKKPSDGDADTQQTSAALSPGERCVVFSLPSIRSAPAFSSVRLWRLVSRYTSPMPACCLLMSCNKSSLTPMSERCLLTPSIGHCMSCDTWCQLTLLLYLFMVLNVHSSLLQLIRDGGKGGGYFCPITYSLHCHRQNNSALRQAGV